MEKHLELIERRINVVKMSIISKVIHRFNTIPIKIPMPSFIVIKQF